MMSRVALEGISRGVLGVVNIFPPHCVVSVPVPEDAKTVEFLFSDGTR
jgi:hypothetical protein